MSHWAKIEPNSGLVEWVLVGNDEFEDNGLSLLQKEFGGVWIQCSYNTLGGEHALNGIPLRKNFPSVGFTYDKVRDAFIPPKTNCHPEEILNEVTCLWTCNNLEHIPREIPSE